MVLTLPGCFYLVPVPTVEPNASPEYVSVWPDSGAIVTLGADPKTVTVIMSDDDDLTFIWGLTQDGYVGTATPLPRDGDIQGSQLVLTGDPDLDGQTLSCLVTDDLSDDVTYQWPLEVL